MDANVRHCADDRAKTMEVVMETKDGKFRYRLLADYAQGLPKDLELVQVSGNLTGGCCDQEGNLYCGMFNPNPFDKYPLTCLLKLDPDGNFLERIGEGTIHELSTFRFTDHGTIILTQTHGNCFVEISADGTKELGVIGDRKPSDTKRDTKIFSKVRMHGGIFPTEPTLDFNGGLYEKFLEHEGMEMAGPFNQPTDVAYDSKGNYYFTDGYSNFAVHKFSKDGTYIKTWGGKSSFDPYQETPGKFLVPHAICVDRNDNVWVCDREKDAVHVFDTDGNLLAFCSGNLGQPSGVDTDGEYVYVLGRAGFLTIFSLDMEIAGTLGVYNGNLRGGRICCDSKGNLYIFPGQANPDHQLMALKRLP